MGKRKGRHKMTWRLQRILDKDGRVIAAIDPTKIIGMVEIDSQKTCIVFSNTDSKIVLPVPYNVVEIALRT